MDKIFCYNMDVEKHSYDDNVDKKNEIFLFTFQINSFIDLNFDTSEYYYNIIEKNYFSHYSKEKLNGQIDLINSYTEINLKPIKKGGYLYNEPFLDFIYYKLFFDEYYIHQGIFYGQDKSNNNLELNNGAYSKIFKNKSVLRYQLSEEEKNNNGVHLKLKLSIYNYNQRKRISEIKEFNFYICQEGYQSCDIETSMMCLKEGEGYYKSNGRYYSCYKTCKTCQNFGKPGDADYFKNYCDVCKEEYPYYINMGNYKSCYKECPSHAKELKYHNKTECISYCPKYKTIEGKCVDYCDYEIYKYLLENTSTCYNYIPKNFYIYIDNYTNNYFNIDKPIIKLGEKCPDYNYDSSLNNFCINLEEDIFNLVTNPKELIIYNERLIKKVETKNIIIRTYKSNNKLDDIDNNKNKYIHIDISLCEKKLKEYYTKRIKLFFM